MKAFPHKKIDNSGYDVYVSGMDLRDYFASDAMKALIQASTTLGENSEISFSNGILCGVGDVLSAEEYDENGKAHHISWAKWYADEAYVLADAMMKARDGNAGR